MGRFWWTVWIKVAVLAVALLVAYQTVSGFVEDAFAPYLLEASVAEDSLPAEDGEESVDPIRELVGSFEEKFGVYIDYERFIFDFANGYAQQMMEESEAERTVTDSALH